MLRFHELSPSPNNTKVRMALRYKGIEFEAVPIDYRDRSPLVRLSGQELTPVIEDRGVVLNESEAILAYLDANYPDTLRLVPAHRAGRKECDAFKRELDEKVAVHWLPVFLYAIDRVQTLDEAARSRFHDALRRLDEEIGDRASFKDDPEMAICDLRVAQWATYAFPGEGLSARVPLFATLRDQFAMQSGSLPNLERFIEPWNERLS